MASHHALLRAVVLVATLAIVTAGCPFAGRRAATTQSDALSARRLLLETTAINDSPDGGSVPEGGFAAVKADIAAALTDSQEFWPADFGNYGPFMIRLAWHCTGSYRRSDGRGGCDGGRIRFGPEANWPDNANLDKALQLLQPIKDKYGESLSWGDLIVLTGNVAIETMGGKTLGFCGGRVDDPDGSASLRLGPSPEQEAIAPCEVNGLCTSPLGPTTVGLIYVNPEGPLANPDPLGSAADIESSFGRMGLNDSETVAFIGGGHAFGKTHGACSSPPCGNAKGNNTFTSGFEGTWTLEPTTWTNRYFSNLLDFEWEVHTGPGGHNQWRPKNADGTDGPAIMMLTSDVAFKESPKYRPFIEKWSADLDDITDAFAHVWYKVTTSDMGPASRCMGEEVPPPQDWQGGLPPMPDTLPDYQAAKDSISALIDADPENGPKFMALAQACASTFRATDYRGGCNGARIRFAPEADWPSNAGAADILAVLQPVKDANPDISYSDLIVLAGSQALSKASNMPVDFCGGRTDADEVTAAYSDPLAPRHYTPLTVSLEDDMLVKGLTPRQYIALMGAPRAGIASNLTALGELSSQHWTMLSDNATYGTETERALLEMPAWSDIVMEFKADEQAFMTELVSAWTTLMNADRFEANCGAEDASASDAPPPTSAAASSLASFMPLATLLAAVSALLAML